MVEQPNVAALLWLSDDFLCEEIPLEHVDDWMDAISSSNTMDNSSESNNSRVREANIFLDSIGAGFHVMGSRVEANGALSWVLAPVVYAK